MNNHRLLGRVLTAFLLGLLGRAAGSAQEVVSLDRLFEIAESNSAQLRPAFTAQEEALQEIRVARSARLPEIEAKLSLGYIGDGFTTARNFSDYQKAPIPHFQDGLSLNVTQPVYTGGAISVGIDMARQKSTAARFATDLRRDNLRLQLTGMYLDLYKCRNLRAVVESNLALANKVLADMTARHSQGVALKNDIVRYELLVSNFELQLIKLDNTLDILNHDIVTTAGMPEGTVIVPDSTLLARSLPVDGEQWWQDQASQAAPALGLARTALDISCSAERLVKSERLPKVGLQAGWTNDGPILVEVPPINRNLSYWFVGVGVSYNLSSLYKTNRSLAKSRLATQRSREELDAAAENVAMGVRTSYVRYIESYEELKTRTKGVELAVRNYNTTSMRYSADMALITDMLDAATSRLEAEQQLVNARIDLIFNYYKLLFNSGKI